MAGRRLPRLLIFIAALGALLAAAAAPRADVRINKRDSALLKQKVATITAHGERVT